jgi:DNA-binding CsgD family transcriptional regulator
MPGDLWDAVDSIYQLRGSNEVWLRRLLETLRPHLDIGLGIGGYYFDARAAPELIVTHLTSVGMKQREVAIVAQILQAMRAPNERTRRVLALHDGCGTASEVMTPRLFRSMPNLVTLSRIGSIRDFFGIVAADPGGQGCVINVPLPRQQRSSPGVRRRWGRVAAHVASALRLRRAMLGVVEAHDPAASIDAIFDPRGRALHLASGPVDGSARGKLTEAVQRRERARASIRRLGEDDALSEWMALVAGEWTLLDEIERDGRRIIIARRNPASRPPLARLTPAQAQVVGFALLGHSNKLIAYELGLTESGVAMRLRRAGRALGATSRLALIRTVRQLLERAP